MLSARIIYILCVIIISEREINMNYLQNMNSAIDYIEEHIIEDIDYEKAASIVCCSLPRFHNIFQFITGITPLEYVKSRRMAISAAELINSDVKIIDLAHKYGYESPEAFTRYFKMFHGLSPTAARKYKKYIDYPPISLQIKVIGGHYTMQTNTQMTVYKDILVKVERVNYPETLKIAGLSWQSGFANIGDYHRDYLGMLNNKFEPYTDAEISFHTENDGQWIFGGRVTSVDNLPHGMIGIDTGYKSFDVLTFRAVDLGTLLGDGENAGDAMKTAGEYVKNVWYPAHKDEVDSIEGDDKYGMIIDGEAWTCGNIGIYKDTSNENPEMCFYLPLKSGRENGEIRLVPAIANHASEKLSVAETYFSQGKTMTIDLTTMTKRNDVDLHFDEGNMVMTSPGWDSGMVTQQWFNGPVKIELRAKTNSNNIRLYYNFGQVILAWEHRLNELRINDIIDDRHYGYPGCGNLPADEFVDIEWIIGQDIMAVKVNGELRHAGTHYPYINKLKKTDFELYSPVRVGAAMDSTVTVEHLKVTEL